MIHQSKNNILPLCYFSACSQFILAILLTVIAVYNDMPQLM